MTYQDDTYFNLHNTMRALAPFDPETPLWFSAHGCQVGPFVPARHIVHILA
mgnify:CR=1 FL=1|jgi:hypothetical protein